jgi:hypothetical protein
VTCDVTLTESIDMTDPLPPAVDLPRFCGHSR